MGCKVVAEVINAGTSVFIEIHAGVPCARPKQITLPFGGNRYISGAALEEIFPSGKNVGHQPIVFLAQPVKIA